MGLSDCNEPSLQYFKGANDLLCFIKVSLGEQVEEKRRDGRWIGEENESSFHENIRVLRRNQLFLHVQERVQYCRVTWNEEPIDWMVE